MAGNDAFPACFRVGTEIASGDGEMKALTWKPILSNLTEANGELRNLLWRLHYLVFRELPEDCPERADASYVAWYARQEERHPFAEGSLFVSLEHAYHHLNWAWNCRHTSEDRVWHFTESAAKRWSRFPDTADFADLWPLDRTVRVAKDDLGLIGSRKKISLFPLRPEIYLAQRKLNILCHFVEKECFGEEVVVPPKGMRADVWQKLLMEKDFVRRLHLIYACLNMAWNCRTRKTYPNSDNARQQCSCFPPAFSTGSHNMWRTRRTNGPE